MTSAPLDNLVISQLAAIRNREAALYQEMLSESELNANTVQVQLLELQQRADRLGRMLDAMGVTNSPWHSETMTPIAA